MKMFLVLRAGSLLLILLLLPLSRAVQAVPLLVTSAPGTVTPGGTFDVTFGFDGFTGAAGDSLAGFDVDIFFDTTLLSFVGGRFGATVTTNPLDLAEADALPFAGSITESAPGRLDIFGLSGNSQGVLDASQPNAFVFLALTFTTLAEGAATVGIDLLDPTLLFVDSANNLLTPLGTSTFATTVQVGQPPAARVPEPGSLMLIGVGLSTLVAARTRRNRLRVVSRL